MLGILPKFLNQNTATLGPYLLQLGVRQVLASMAWVSTTLLSVASIKTPLGYTDADADTWI